MDAGILDHLLALLLIVLMPLAGLREHDRMLRALRRGEAAARRHTYRRTLLKEWGLAVLVLAVWFLAGRTPGDIGVSTRHGLLAWIGWGLALAGVAALVAQAILVTRSAAALAAVRRQMHTLEDLVPHDAAESRLFAVLSLTAGICEELVYRGFLLHYGTGLIGLWPAVVVTSLVFGLGHLYQGWRGVLKTAAVGLAMALLVLLTGGLWAAMLVHAVIDLTSGHMARRALEGGQVAEA